MDLAKELDLSFAIHEWQKRALLESDPVLAGDGAAEFDAHVQDFPSRLLGAFPFARFFTIVEQVGVDVAIARVADIGAPEVDAGGDL